MHIGYMHHAIAIKRCGEATTLHLNALHTKTISLYHRAIRPRQPRQQLKPQTLDKKALERRTKERSHARHSQIQDKDQGRSHQQRDYIEC